MRGQRTAGPWHAGVAITTSVRDRAGFNGRAALVALVGERRRDLARSRLQKRSATRAPQERTIDARPAIGSAFAATYQRALAAENRIQCGIASASPHDLVRLQQEAGSGSRLNP